MSSSANSPPSAVASFLAGLTSRTKFSLALTVFVAVCTSYFGATEVTESWMVHEGQIFSAGKGDWHAEVTLAALAAKQGPPPRQSLLVLAGHRSGHVSPAYDDGEAVLDLRTPYQSLYETFSLLDQVPSGPGVKVVITITPELLQQRASAISEMANRSKIGVRSVSATVEVMRRGLRAVPLRGNYFVDNQSYLLARAPIVARNVLFQVTGWAWLRPGVPSELQPSDACPNPIDLALLQENLMSLGSLIDRLKFRRFPQPFVVLQLERSLAESALRWRAKAMVEVKGGQFRMALVEESSASPTLREIREWLSEP